MNQLVSPEQNVFIGILIVALGLWTIFWKGVALWRAARYEQKKWFIVILGILLFINTIGILELVYLFKFAKKPLTITEIRGWLNIDKNKPKTKTK